MHREGVVVVELILCFSKPFNVHRVLSGAMTAVRDILWYLCAATRNDKGFSVDRLGREMRTDFFTARALGVRNPKRAG